MIDSILTSPIKKSGTTPYNSSFILLVLLSLISIVQGCGGGGAVDEDPQDEPSVGLIDFQGDVEFFDVQRSAGFPPELFVEADAIFQSLSIYELAEATSSIDNEFDISFSTDTIRFVFKYTGGNSEQTEGTIARQGQFGMTFRFMTWNYNSDGSLTMFEFPLGFDPEAEDEFVVPDQWLITPIVSDTPNQVLVQLLTSEGSEVAYISTFEQVETELTPLTANTFSNQFYRFYSGSRGRLETIQLLPPSSNNGDVFNVRTELEGIGTENYPDAIYRQQLAADISNDRSTSQFTFINNGILLTYADNSVEFLLANNFFESDNTFTVCGLGRRDNIVTQEEIDTLIARSTDFCTYRNLPEWYNSVLSFDESQALALAFSRSYTPNRNQGAEMDADDDGIQDLVDGDPLDPNESLDSDNDGFGDNGDPCPADAEDFVNGAVFEGCPEGISP